MTVCAGPRDAADNPPSCCASSGVSELVSRDKNTQEGFFCPALQPCPMPSCPTEAPPQAGKPGKEAWDIPELGPYFHSVLQFFFFFNGPWVMLKLKHR